MNVYIESNFVLELALVQEQHASCEEILSFAEAGRVRLVIPSYSLVEPYETLRRRHQSRRRMKLDLDQELIQLARTAAYSERLNGLREATTLLIDSADEEAKRLESVRSRILGSAEVIPLERNILTALARQQTEFDLSPQDAIVLSSVLSHLDQAAPSESCFLNRNSKDFDNPNIIEKLDQYRCKLLWRFEDGCQYLQHMLS